MLALKCKRHTDKDRENMNGPHLKKCPHCGGKVESVITAPAIQFKAPAGMSPITQENVRRDSSKPDKSDKGEKSEKTEKSEKSEKSESKPAALSSEKKNGSSQKKSRLPPIVLLFLGKSLPEEPASSDHQKHIPPFAWMTELRFPAEYALLKLEAAKYRGNLFRTIGFRGQSNSGFQKPSLSPAS